MPDAETTTTRFEPASQSVARHLREAIYEGRLVPGERIRQEAIAVRLGTSRIPVREALRLLETEGLVVLVPHVGARVARMDLDELEELYRIREAMEPLAASESVGHLNAAQVGALRELVGVIESSADDTHQWLEADREFHLGIYAEAGMPRVLAMIEGFWNTTQQYRRAYMETLDERRHAIVTADHRLILDAVERRDPVDAEHLVRSHIRRTRITLHERPELFPADHAAPGHAGMSR